jgi:NADPH2 dehydrogenase
MAYLLNPLHSDLLSLPNRLVMPPMATAKSESDGKVSPAMLEFYREKSAGGQLGLVIVEHSFVHQTGKASTNQLSVADDSVIAGLKQLADVLHGNGVKAIMQINHAGSAASAEITGTHPVGPSAIVNPRKGGVPQELTQQEIDDVVTSFQNAASRVKAAGFDGVEIHSAHGYLLNQFFSPLTNLRTDAYGGSVENRIKIHLQVIKAVRQAVGPDYPILLRLGAADFVEGGSTIQDSQVAARAFEKAGVNILDISGGFSGYINPGNNQPGYFSSLSGAIKEVVSIPVILTGGISTAEAAEALLAAGKADLIGVGRAILQDSQWVKKTLASIQS